MNTQNYINVSEEDIDEKKELKDFEENSYFF